MPAGDEDSHVAQLVNEILLPRQTIKCNKYNMSMQRRSKKPHIVVAGKEPPPVGGQNLLIAELLRDLRSDGRSCASHLDLAFTKDWTKARKFSPTKLFELWRVWTEMRGIAKTKPVDILLYPVGGPQTVPLFRDAILLPLLRPYCRKLIMHFHAAGYAMAAPHLSFPLKQLIRRAYASTDEAVVMTEFGREDAVAAGIRKIHVSPNMLRDTFDPTKIEDRRKSPKAKILYLGHVYKEKGVFDLLDALVNIKKPFDLRIVGDCLAPWTPERLRDRIDKAGLDNVVEYVGGVDEKNRDAELARADFLVFPSRAAESFGLVLAEAMMWRLPVITFDWRGNNEVLGEDPGGFLLPGENRIDELAGAVTEMLDKQELWQVWGECNRQRFLKKFNKPDQNIPIVELLLAAAVG